LPTTSDLTAVGPEGGDVLLIYGGYW